MLKLDAELAGEKTKSGQLQDMAVTNAKLYDDLKSQLQEAISMKKDLMDNFEAQQHEFDGERRLFEDENSRLKVKVEELEEELDRLLGSHDNARVNIDERTKAFDAEIDRIRKETADQVQKAQGQVDFVKNDCEKQREKANKLGRQAQEHEEEKSNLLRKISSLQTAIDTREATQAEHLRSLQATHRHFSKDENTPTNFDSLVDAIEILGEKTAGHLQDLTQALATLRTHTEEKSRATESEVSGLKHRLSAEETKVATLRKELERRKAQQITLESEIEDSRTKLENLRSKFALGETGSEALRSRVTEEEMKVEGLSSQLATVTAHVGRLEAVAKTRTQDVESMQKAHAVVAKWLQDRAQRAEEISSRLFSQCNRLGRLLEHIGFTVTKQEGGMVVQRTPRANSASGILIDQSQSMNRSLSNPLPSKFEEAPPDHIHWALVDNSADEQKSFDAFIHDIQGFNIDTFSEVIIKRVKDAEHIARKWQREAKSYRDKAQRAQLEAHDKLAYRSFKDGDLALFLPTRNQTNKPWAAFNVGAPHYFLREQDTHRLRTRDWLVARISKIEERVVDLSKSLNGLRPPAREGHQSIAEAGMSAEDENPFELSDGLRWYLLDAAEEKSGAPSTPGLGKSTVASAHVDAKGSIERKKDSDEGAATRTLTKNLDSRRSSTNSRQSLVGGSGVSPDAKGKGTDRHNPGAQDDSTPGGPPTESLSSRPRSAHRRAPEDVRRDLLWGP
jgi:autophagy-related protein 11